ncbi:MAG: AraC family transcriptional regulator [Pseudomonadota bacterium]
MGYVTSLFARKMVAAAGGSVDARALLASAGLDADGPWDPKVMLTDARYYALLERIAAEVDVTDLPVRVGASMQCDEYGALGLAWKAAPNLLGSFSRIARYAELMTNVVQYELRPEPRGTWFVLHRGGVRRLGLRLSNEATLASAVSLARQVCPEPFAPLEVHFQHASPVNTHAHADWFGCPLCFDARHDALLLSPASLAVPNRLGDDGMSRYLLSQLDVELTQLPAPDTVVTQARDAILQALSEGAPRMADIAQGLGLSTRSFHRRLADHGVHFQALTEATRRDLAEGLLQAGGHSLADIAFLTGFSEQSAFTRAFKRWHGLTPAQYRRQHRR